MKYNLSPQENEYWCFPACLQAVLRAYFIEESQRAIADEIRVTEEYGANLLSVELFLDRRGFEFRYHNYNAVPFNEPDFLLSQSSRRGADVVIAIPGRRLNHVLLMTEFKDPMLSLLDPEGRINEGNLYDLLKDMHQRQTGGFGVIDKLRS